MINIYVMRHGQAEVQALSDKDRELTSYGRQEASLNAQWLREQIKELDLVLVSPYTRALQTLTQVKSGFMAPNRQTVLEELIPSGSAKEVHDYIDAMIALYKPRNILIVSHMPLVSFLVETLTQDHQAPIFATAAIADIRYNPEKLKGELVGMQMAEFV